MVGEAAAAKTDQETDPASTQDGRLLRLAADTIPATADPDLDAAARLVDEYEGDDSPNNARGLNFVRTELPYASEGQRIRMEVLRPDSDGRRPAILILHGASGIGDGAFYRNAAEIFAERGYVTFLPHYLATSPAPAPKAGKGKAAKAKSSGKPPVNGTGAIRADFRHQEKILRDAIEAIAANPYVDPSRIGVFGMSLGGFHALNLSSTDDRIAAVVNMAGALRGNTMPESNRVAPTLALHGARDGTVPVSRARSLDTYLKRAGIDHEVVIYPDQGHFFRGKARQDAFQRSVTFFGSYLQPAAPSSTATTAPAQRRPY